MGQKSILIAERVLLVRPLPYWLRHREFKAVLVERAVRFRKGGYMIDSWGMDLFSLSACR